MHAGGRATHPPISINPNCKDDQILVNKRPSLRPQGVLEQVSQQPLIINFKYPQLMNAERSLVSGVSRMMADPLRSRGRVAETAQAVQDHHWRSDQECLRRIIKIVVGCSKGK
jgi:hypothetical protein